MDAFDRGFANFPVPAPFSSKEVWLEVLRERDAREKRLINAACALLNLVFDNGAGDQVEELRAAALDFFTGENSKVIGAVEQEAVFPVPSAFDQRMRSMAWAVEERDRIQVRLLAAEDACQQLPAGLDGMMEASVVMPLRDQLSDIESRIRIINADMEGVPQSSVVAVPKESAVLTVENSSERGVPE